jgi:magnesium transporter
MISILKYNSKDGIQEIIPEQMKFWDANSPDNLWIDIWNEHEKTSTDILKGVFNFHPLAIEDSVKYLDDEMVHHPKIDNFGDYIFIVFNGISKTIPEFDIFSLSCFIGKNYIVTLHNEKDNNSILESLSPANKEYLLRKGPDYALHIILDELVDRYYPVIDHYEDEIDKIEEDIFQKNPDNEILRGILDFKKKALKIRKITSYQKEILFRLSRGDFEIIDAKEMIYYRNVYDHLIRISDTADTMRELISGMLDSYLSIVNNKLNNIMKVLTIIATIILPLNLITGVYGMNFDVMPMLHSENGFFITIGSMVTLVTIMLLWFRKRKWI